MIYGARTPCEREKTKEGEILRKQRVKRNIGAGSIFGRLFVRIASVMFVIGCILYTGYTMVTVSEKQDELTRIQEKTVAIEAENVELSRILEAEDMDAYMEKIAIENMNYAYPNERRFYDTSRN